MITLECGCEFQQDEQGRIIFDTDITKMNMNCSATWDLICEGNTKGVFHRKQASVSKFKGAFK